MPDSFWNVISTCLQIIFGKRLKFDEAGITVCVTKTPVGEGSYSDVLKGIDVNNFRKYAIKKMLIQSEESEQNIKNEIESFNRFRHPHILTCLAHQYCIDRKREINVAYLVFPFIKSGNLRQLLDAILSKKLNQLDYFKLLNDWKAIAEALLVLHSFSPAYVHNDLKPEVYVLLLQNSTIFLDH